MRIFRKPKIISLRGTNEMAVKTAVLAFFLISCDKVPSDVQIPSQNQTEEKDKTEIPKDNNPNDIPDQNNSSPGQEETVSNQVKAAKLSDTNCIDPQLSELKKGIKIMLCDGTIATGLLVQPDLANLTPQNIRSGISINGVQGIIFVENHASCTDNNQVGCVTTLEYRSAELSKLLAQNIKMGVTIAGIAGNSPLETHVECSDNALIGCITTSVYKSADLTNVVPDKILLGVNIAGITGVVLNSSFLPRCTTDGSNSCVTTSRFKSADTESFQAQDIRSGVTIAGLPGQIDIHPSKVRKGMWIGLVQGKFPSDEYPLGLATESTGLTSENFDQKVKDGSEFVWFDKFGNRHTKIGDQDLIPSNIKNSVNIYGTIGSFMDVDPWDLRAGTVVGEVVGKLKTNCRNASNFAAQDMALPGKMATVNPSPTNTLTVTSHGLSSGDWVRLIYLSAPTGLSGTATYAAIAVDQNNIRLGTVASPSTPISFTTSGSGVYIVRWQDTSKDNWDNIDDLNGNGYFPITYPTAWTTDNYCAGVETSEGDDNLWKDVTSTICDSASDDCVFKDKSSGIEWSEHFGFSMNWVVAVQYCDDLVFDGKSDWRLPSQKESLDAYLHGIRSAGNDLWIATNQMANNNVWTSTTHSSTSTQAYATYLGQGVSAGVLKASAVGVVCVR